MWVRVHASRTVAEAHVVRHTLGAAGIDTQVRGEARASLGGEIPMSDAMVEVYVPEPFAEEARRILDEVENDARREPRRCPGCGEENPGHFASCWSCGRAIDEAGP